MFAAIGHRVLALKRVAYGNLQLDNLPSGKFRILSKQDIEKIFSSA
jgi:23S rRNA pseudouridine2605 synthase